MNKIKYLIFSLVLMMCSISLVSANEIDSITVHLTLDENGNGHIKEIWQADMDSKTELYKQMGDLGNSEITNYKVTMDGTLFDYISNWDIDASFSNKAYKKA